MISHNSSITQVCALVQEELSAAGFIKAASDASLAQKVASKTKKRERRSDKASQTDAFRVFSSPGGLQVTRTLGHHRSGRSGNLHAVFPDADMIDTGHQVLVGRNNRSNDELTHRVARPTDVWLHARGVAGAHVLLRVPNDAPDAVSLADLQFAADLAAFFCKVPGVQSRPPMLHANNSIRFICIAKLISCTRRLVLTARYQ